MARAMTDAALIWLAARYRSAGCGYLDAAAAVGYAKFYSRSSDAVSVYDDAGKVIETHEHAGDFKERWVRVWISIRR
jgi:hypothetical protein